MIKIKQFFIKFISHKAAQNFLIIGVIAVFQLINNVILGRKLEKEEFGLYTFVLSNLVGLLSTLLLFGRTTSILRFFSSKDFLDYQWKKYLLNFYAIILIPLLIIMVGVKLIYKLDWYWFWMGVISSYMMCCTAIIADLLRSKGYFTSTSLLLRASAVVLTIVLVILNFCFNSLDLTTASIARIISYSIQIPFIIYIMIKWRQGSEKIDKKIFKDSWAFWEINLTVIVLSSIDALLIAKLLDFKELALFGVMWSILQIYEFARISIFNIYSQKFSRAQHIDIASFNRFILIIIIIITTFYLISTDFLLDILFKGKYSVTLLQLILFCLYSSITFIYVLPSCYLIGQSSSRDLKFMLGVNITGIIMKVSLIILLSRFGITGFLISGIFTQFLRTASGYYMVFKNKNIKWTDLFKLIDRKSFGKHE